MHLGSLWETRLFPPHSLLLTIQEKVYEAYCGEIIKSKEVKSFEFYSSPTIQDNKSSWPFLLFKEKTHSGGRQAAVSRADKLAMLSS